MPICWLRFQSWQSFDVTLGIRIGILADGVVLVPVCSFDPNQQLIAPIDALFPLLAGRLTASRPMTPVPAKTSKKRRSGTASPRMLKRASRTLCGVGLIFGLTEHNTFRPRSSPATMRISVRISTHRPGRRETGDLLLLFSFAGERQMRQPRKA